MSRANGFALLLSKDRMDLLLECVEECESFGEAVVDFQHSRNVPLVCFIVHEEKITHIGRGNRGLRAGTNLRRLNIDKVEKLTKSLSVPQIIENLPPKHIKYVERRFHSSGLLTEKSFIAVIEVIRQLAPQASTLLDRLSQNKIDYLRHLLPEVKNSLAQQQEAVLCALSIAELHKKPLQAWSRPEEGTTHKSFLYGLPKTRLREDQMIINDYDKVPGYKSIEKHITGYQVFQSEKIPSERRLIVFIANRFPLEQQTGTDLIYYNETFQSFVMVQYKAMEKEDRANGRSQTVFRLPNEQLTKEITCMDNLLKNLQKCPTNKLHNGYRFTENPFFLKLCSRLVFNPDNIGMMPGMYLPLDYWKLLVQSNNIKGPHGGSSVTFENTGRYLNNTEFINIVSKAWVGTTPSQSDFLEEVVRDVLETGKAVVFAINQENVICGHE